MIKNIYIIGIGWIWVSGIARYYNYLWYKVYGSDMSNSPLIDELRSENIDIFIWERLDIFDEIDFDLVAYSEAIPLSQLELDKAIKLDIKSMSYPEALWEITSSKKLIAIAGTHGKSTTTAMISLMLKDSLHEINAIVWSKLSEFGGSNAHFSDSPYFVIEACEYKRSFLNYKPHIWVITNIDIDHLDYYRDLDDYIDAFKSFISNIRPNWYLVASSKDTNLQKTLNLLWYDKDSGINIILISDYSFILDDKECYFPTLKLNIPWTHIEFDAKLAFVVWKILQMPDSEIVSELTKYNGIWRRSELVGTTVNNNILLSDYGHHPRELRLNLKALKDKYRNKEIITIFQPHQHSRTIELIDDFKDAFIDSDKVIVPNIYKSRDTKENIERMPASRFVELLNHADKIYSKDFEKTLEIIEDLDAKNPWKLVFILQWAWDIDNLRYKVKLKQTLEF